MQEGFPELTIWISETPLIKSGSFGVELAKIKADPEDINFIVEEIEKAYKLSKRIDTPTAQVIVTLNGNTCLDGLLENGEFVRGVKIS